MVMAMTMMMVVVVVIVIVMVVRVIVPVRVMRISAAFGIERRFNRCQPRAQTLQHRLERAVRPHAQAVGKNLHRHVPVAEVPGNPRQMRQVVAANLDQRLRLDHHVDDAAVVEFERVPVAQENRLGKHRADLSAVHAGEMPGLQAALIRLENRWS